MCGRSGDGSVALEADELFELLVAELGLDEEEARLVERDEADPGVLDLARLELVDDALAVRYLHLARLGHNDGEVDVGAAEAE